MEFALSAKNCLILALSAKLCRSDESAIELGYFSLSAKLCRFWRPLIAVSHTRTGEAHLLLDALKNARMRENLSKSGYLSHPARDRGQRCGGNVDCHSR